MKNALTVLVALGALCVFGCESKSEQVTPEPAKPASTPEAAKPAPKAEPAKPAAAESAKPASTSGGW
ncbi:hypothetical protein [Sorangium sp. So ce131]|uniref:hypothetical protein n=1 Tax=Sorangium sp. So ce131 TaxID=3133282 RepID=UPI003F61EEE3